MCDLSVEEMARQERNRYARQWRAKNPERAKEASRRYWEKRAKEAAERGEQNADNPDN